MDAQKENKNGLIGQIITYVFAALGLIITVINMIAGGGNNLLAQILIAVIFILIFIYAFTGYKKPHGNMLKWTMLLYAVLRVIAASQIIDKSFVVALPALSAICVAYMCGRLNKREKNLYWLYIAGALELISAVIMVTNASGFLDGLAMFTPLFGLIALFGAYFAKFEEHKNAGLSEEE